MGPDFEPPPLRTAPAVHLMSFDNKEAARVVEASNERRIEVES